MGYWAVLLSPRFLVVLSGVALLQPAVLVLADRLENLTRHAPWVHGVMEYVMRPLLYALLALLFLRLAYPLLYGVDKAPAFLARPEAGGQSAGSLINLLFLLGLLLPNLPLLGRYRGVVTALQVMIAAAVLFSWAAPLLGSQGAVNLWPPVGLLLQLLVMALLFHRLAVHAGVVLGGQLAVS